MNGPVSCIYAGEVVHRRVKPVTHSLRYRVYNLFVDIDELPQMSQRLWLFSYNRFNVFSVSDRQFGPGDGTPIASHVWSLVRAAGYGGEVKRIFMLCFPAIFGRTFNPLTTYYGCDEHGLLRLMIYEVSNTFGERHTYVIPAAEKSRHSHAKGFYVSPFNDRNGRYDFAAETPGDSLFLGITLKVDEAPVLQAWFRGERRTLSDATLLRSFFSVPLQPVKVILGIHLEAVKLWWKGLRITARPEAILPNVSFAKNHATERSRQ